MNSGRFLHIVSFDIPYPPDYGGVIDVYYKLKTLSESGIKITLHCFEYNRTAAKQLDKYCQKIYYYKRKVKKQLMFKTTPYIVSSRMDQELLNNLMVDQSPILFEGLHCTAFLNHPELSDRKKIVRSHNIEHVYYQNLGKAEKDLFKKYYFMNEATKLEQYETILQHASHIACISKNETEYYEKLFQNAFYLPAFHAFNQVESKSGIGQYVLYHGNLSVSENVEAALALIKHFAPKSFLPLIIAGKKPTSQLRKAIAKNDSVQLIANPGNTEMMGLIADAHIHILPGEYSAGVKLKLLNALYNGRHVITTEAMLLGSGLEKTCFVCNSFDSIIKTSNKLSKIEFEDYHIKKRENYLTKLYNNSRNAEKLCKIIYAS